MADEPNFASGKAFEETAHLTQNELRDAIDIVPAIVWSTLPDGTVDFLNQRWLEYTGMSQEEAVGRGWEATVHPDDLAEFIARRKQSVESGQPRGAEFRVRRSDGEYRWWFSRTVPLRDASGNIVKWYGTGLDIEDRKRAEQELARTAAERARLAAFREDVGTALAHQGDLRGILQSCAEAVVQHLHAAFARIWIVSGGGHELQLQASAGMYTHLDGSHGRIGVGDLKIGLIAQARKPHLTNDVQNDPGVSDKEWVRREKLASFAGCPLIAEDRLVGVMAMFSREPLSESTIHNLTVASDGIAQAVERKRAETALRRSEAYMAEAQKLTHTGSWAWSPLIRENTYWSTEHYRILGLDPAKDSASFDAVLQRMPPEDRVKFEQVVGEAIRKKSDFEVDWRVQLDDGSIRQLHSVGHPELNSAGELTELIGTCMDVTEQRDARAALEKAFEEIKTLRDQLYHENLALRDEIDRTSMFEEIVGASKALHSVLSRVTKVAPTDSTVLITGESGTGKELIARAIHKMSRRSGRAFVSVNCAALSPSLIASELFGHEKGAFTGALQRRLGRFELADGGTIFLDEAGELPPDTQVALLRVLQERELERVGGTQSIKVDVRVIAATNRDLMTATAQGTFRQDLFYRLNVFPIEMPPLRDRKDDILLLVEYFVKRYASRAGKDIRSVDKKTLQRFQSYDWPGNIRELQNVIERSVILSSGDVFSVDASWFKKESSPPARHAPDSTPLRPATRGEREIIETALAECRGRVAGPSGAAAKLGVPASTLESRIKALKIQKSHFKFR